MDLFLQILLVSFAIGFLGIMLTKLKELLVKYMRLVKMFKIELSPTRQMFFNCYKYGFIILMTILFVGIGMCHYAECIGRCNKYSAECW